MKYKAEINILPEYINDETHIINRAAKKLKLTPVQVTSFNIIRRSLDARKKPVYRLVIEVYVGEKPKE